MERVYKYEIVRHGRHIRVYMDEDVNINKMIKRDIIGMRNKLVLHYRFDE